MMEKAKKIRRSIDYEALYSMLEAGPITSTDIEAATGASRRNVTQIITTLSLRYPVYSPRRGEYALLKFDEEESDE